MQIFQVLRKNCDSMGVSSKLTSFNKKLLSIIVINFPLYFLHWIYLLHEANSPQEYIGSIYVINARSTIFLSILSTAFVSEKLFSFIDGIDELVNESE